MQKAIVEIFDAQVKNKKAVRLVGYKERRKSFLERPIQ